MADFGLKASKSGKDYTESDARFFTLHSKYNTLKIHQQGYDYVTLTTSDHTITVDIDHDLGYKPILLLYFYHPEDDTWHLAPARTQTAPGGGSYDLRAGWEHVDTDTVRLTIGDVVSAQVSSDTDVYYKYYIFKDPAKDAWT